MSTLGQGSKVLLTGGGDGQLIAWSWPLCQWSYSNWLGCFSETGVCVGILTQLALRTIVQTHHSRIQFAACDRGKLTMASLTMAS